MEARTVVLANHLVARRHGTLATPPSQFRRRTTNCCATNLTGILLRPPGDLANPVSHLYRVRFVAFPAFHLANPAPSALGSQIAISCDLNSAMGRAAYLGPEFQREFPKGP